MRESPRRAAQRQARLSLQWQVERLPGLRLVVPAAYRQDPSGTFPALTTVVDDQLIIADFNEVGFFRPGRDRVEVGLDQRQHGRRAGAVVSHRGFRGWSADPAGEDQVLSDLWPTTLGIGD